MLRITILALRVDWRLLRRAALADLPGSGLLLAAGAPLIFATTTAAYGLGQLVRQGAGPDSAMAIALACWLSIACSLVFAKASGQATVAEAFRRELTPRGIGAGTRAILQRLLDLGGRQILAIPTVLLPLGSFIAALLPVSRVPLACLAMLMFSGQGPLLLRLLARLVRRPLVLGTTLAFLAIPLVHAPTRLAALAAASVLPPGIAALMLTAPGWSAALFLVALLAWDLLLGVAAALVVERLPEAPEERSVRGGSTLGRLSSFLRALGMPAVESALLARELTVLLRWPRFRLGWLVAVVLPALVALKRAPEDDAARLLVVLGIVPWVVSSPLLNRFGIDGAGAQLYWTMALPSEAVFAAKEIAIGLLVVSGLGAAVGGLAAVAGLRGGVSTWTFAFVACLSYTVWTGAVGRLVSTMHAGRVDLRRLSGSAVPPPAALSAALGAALFVGPTLLAAIGIGAPPPESFRLPWLAAVPAILATGAWALTRRLSHLLFVDRRERILSILRP